MSAAPSFGFDCSPNHLPGSRWGLGSRIALRFCLIYFALYCLLTQIFLFLIPGLGEEPPNIGTLRPFRDGVIWTAQHVFGHKQALVYTGSGSGDRVFDWVQVFCVLVTALVGTCIWSAIDRKRTHYRELYKWLLLVMCFVLAGQLFIYGMGKVVPMQMPFPSLTRLLERFGDFSPMGVLWSSVGASPAYERFVGSAELLAGLLLVVPATAMLGGLIALFDMIEVFALNMTYDVPVKLLSFHLILMAVFLLIPSGAAYCSSASPIVP